MRMRSSTERGGAWTAAQLDAVWRKGRMQSGYDPAQVRKDNCNKLIRRTDYGKQSTYGWEVDHIRPVASGGGDQPGNLQPLHWQNNRHKADNFPNWTCALTG